MIRTDELLILMTSADRPWFTIPFWVISTSAKNVLIYDTPAKHRPMLLWDIDKVWYVALNLSYLTELIYSMNCERIYRDISYCRWSYLWYMKCIRDALVWKRSKLKWEKNEGWRESRLLESIVVRFIVDPNVYINLVESVVVCLWTYHAFNVCTVWQYMRCSFEILTWFRLSRFMWDSSFQNGKGMDAKLM